MAFEVIPAIDLRDGKCVRLFQGDYQQQTVFSDDPAAVAAAWTAAGATTIHVVDLDGAVAGEPTSLDSLRAIRGATAATLQYGGGLRSTTALECALEAGADRLVLGTALVIRPDWVAELCARFGDRIVVGIDARDGLVATDGWLKSSAMTTAAMVDRANGIGVRRGLFTDISQDGTLAGPNLQTLREVVEAARFDVSASGGVATLDDVDAIRVTGAAAVIIGRALYTGRIDLREAVARARGGAIETADERR